MKLVFAHGKKRPPLSSSHSSSGTTTPSYPFSISSGPHTPAGTPPTYYPLAHGPNSSEYIHSHHPHFHHSHPHPHTPSRLGRSVSFGIIAEHSTWQCEYTFCRSRAPLIPLREALRIQHLARRTLLLYLRPLFLIIFLFHPKSSRSRPPMSQMASSWRQLRRCRLAPLTLVIHRFQVTILQRTALTMLPAQVHPGQSLCRLYSQKVPGMHLSMDLFLDILVHSEEDFCWIFLILVFRIADDKIMYWISFYLACL